MCYSIGSPKQVVQIQALPLQKDLIQGIDYDEFDRETKASLLMLILIIPEIIICWDGIPFLLRIIIPKKLKK